MENNTNKTYAPEYGEQDKMSYEYVNHPSHYNDYDVEVFEMMNRIWGPEETAIWCKLTAFKYRMRMGNKLNEPIERDLEKEKVYLQKQKEYEALIVKN